MRNNCKNLEGCSTRELILTFQDSNSPDADNAFYVLVNRFSSNLLRTCEVRCDRFGQEPSIAVELVENVFRAYARKPSFSFEKKRIDDDDKAFEVYLNSIASRELTNLYRLQKKKEQGKWSDGKERLVTDLPPLMNLTPRARITLEVLKELPYSHQVIYLTYTSYEKIGSNLPRKLQKELREHLGGIKQATIRAYKKEAMDKIAFALKYSKLKS